MPGFNHTTENMKTKTLLGKGGETMRVKVRSV